MLRDLRQGNPLTANGELALGLKPAKPAGPRNPRSPGRHGSKATKDELRQVRQWLGREALGRRQVKHVTAKTTPEQRAAEKLEYKARKAAYQARPFAIKRPDGKILKRRFNDAAEAVKEALELCVSMKVAPNSYTVVQAG